MMANCGETLQLFRTVHILLQILPYNHSGLLFPIRYLGRFLKQTTYSVGVQRISPQCLI